MSETENISKQRKPLARGTCKQDQAYTAKKKALEVQLNSRPEKSKTNQVWLKLPCRAFDPHHGVHFVQEVFNPFMGGTHLYMSRPLGGGFS